MERPLLSQRLLLERFPGKGGWTYAKLPDVSAAKGNPFGWQKVRGFIDNYELSHVHLMPMGKGQLMISVKAEIRKAIKKQAGDFVDVVLYSLESHLPVPEDFQLCLEDEPNALKSFNNLSTSTQKDYLDWIYAIKSSEEIVKRMALAINKLSAGTPLLPKKL